MDQNARRNSRRRKRRHGHVTERIKCGIATDRKAAVRGLGLWYLLDIINPVTVLVQVPVLLVQWCCLIVFLASATP
jgi:hypothetical protein